MRLLLPLALLLSACSPESPPRPVQPPPDLTKESWYGETVAQLQSLNTRAREHLSAGRKDEAGKLIEQGQPLSKRLLEVRKPTLAAVEAASDLDQLYGEMLVSNRHYGFARQFFQKNVARWKHWRPQTQETERRHKAAEQAIANLDKLEGL
jgi:hypothetical protein